MLPLILVAQDKKQVNGFIQRFISEHAIISSQIFRIEPVKKEISISQIRLIKKEIITAATLPRLFILSDFDLSSLEAQNALLKTLEESTNCYFILVCKNEYKLLTTIRSRSKTIRLENDKKLKVADKEVVELLQNVKEARNYSFLNDQLIGQIAREKAAEFIEKLITYFYLNLEKDPIYSPKIIKTALLIKERLEANNLNPQLGVDRLLIFIYKCYNHINVRKD